MESTLEILQQFYIKMHSDDNHYCVIPGDLCKYTLKCVCCDKRITPPGTIGVTLYHAPVAILRHLEMIDHVDHPMNTFDLSHVPVLFSGMDPFGRAQASFLATLTNISDNDRDTMFCTKVNGAKKGREEFCEAVKVDVSKTKEPNFQASITNTVALVSVLFEDLGVAVELLEKAKNYQTTEEAFPIGHSILFNKTFQFEQGFLKEESHVVKRENLKSLEALCVFGYREFYKNFLLVLVEMHYKISRKKTPVPKRIMDLFGVSTGHIVSHMMRRGKFEQTKFSQAYRMDYNSNHFIV